VGQPLAGGSVLDQVTHVRFVSAAGTDTGRVRSRNEDAFFVSDESGIAVVSDGMGGAPAGAMASALAVEAVRTRLLESVRGGWPVSGVTGIRFALQEAILAAHAGIRDHGQAYPESAGLGATLTAFVADANTGQFAVGHVGDSRAYLVRGPVIRRLTRDDTLLQDAVDEGRMEGTASAGNPLGHILRQVLGMERSPSIQVLDGIVEPGDQVFLCTDGVTAVLEDREVREMLTRGRLWPADTVVRAFLESVNERGGPDNATAVLIRR